MKIEVKTTILETGKILQEINQDKIKQFFKVMYDTKEEQFREALIRLGWTPPSDKFKIQIDLKGCDNNTSWKMKVTEEEYKVLKSMSNTSITLSEISCMPILTVTKLEEENTDAEKNEIEK